MRPTRQRCTALRCVLGILIACLCLSMSAASAVRAAGTFTDAQGRFSFAIPDGLTSDDTYIGQRLAGSEVAAFLFSDAAAAAPGFGDNVNVTVTKVSGDTTDLDVLARNTVQQVSGALHATPDGTGIQSLTIGGLPARQYGYLAVFGGVTVHGTQAFVISEGNAYFITFTASEDMYDDFVVHTRDVLTSFAFDPAI